MKQIANTGGYTPSVPAGGWYIDIWKVNVEGAGPCYIAGLYRAGECVLPNAIGAVGRSWGVRFTVYTHGDVWGVIGSSTELVYRAFARYLTRTWERPEIKYNTFTLESMMTDALVCNDRERVATIELKGFEPFADPNLLY